MHPVRNVKLPSYRIEATIATMNPGDRGYTVPWAITVDLDNNMWINGQYTIHPDTGGTVQLLVVRTEDGVKVAERGLGHYTPTDSWSYVGGDKANDRLPVVELI